MSIYRRKSSAGVRSKRYTAEFVHAGKLYRRNGFVDREQAKHWVMSEQLRVRRDATGYVKAMNSALVSPLIEQYCAGLIESKRDDKYAYVSERRLKRLAEECCWVTLGNMTRDSLEAWMSSGPKYRNKRIGAKTINQFADTGYEFGKWLASRKVRKLPQNPLTDLERPSETHNDLYRRAATIEEIGRLLSTCPPERRLYYIFRLYCPLRGKTIGALTWGMLHLDGTPPWIALPSHVNKSRREERSPLRYDVAAELRKSRGKAAADDLVFPDAPTLKVFKADLKVAGVAFSDAKGLRRFDYHAMRKTLVRLLKSSGVSLDQASLILHHKDPRTTRKHYDDDMVQPELGDALEKLPTLGGGLRRAE